MIKAIYRLLETILLILDLIPIQYYLISIIISDNKCNYCLWYLSTSCKTEMFDSNMFADIAGQITTE